MHKTPQERFTWLGDLPAMLLWGWLGLSATKRPHNQQLFKATHLSETLAVVVKTLMDLRDSLMCGNPLLIAMGDHLEGLTHF